MRFATDTIPKIEGSIRNAKRFLKCACVAQDELRHALLRECQAHLLEAADALQEQFDTEQEDTNEQSTAR